MSIYTLRNEIMLQATDLINKLNIDIPVSSNYRYFRFCVNDKLSRKHFKKCYLINQSTSIILILMIGLKDVNVCPLLKSKHCCKIMCLLFCISTMSFCLGFSYFSTGETVQIAMKVP